MSRATSAENQDTLSNVCVGSIPKTGEIVSPTSHETSSSKVGCCLFGAENWDSLRTSPGELGACGDEIRRSEGAH